MVQLAVEHKDAANAIDRGQGHAQREGRVASPKRRRIAPGSIVLAAQPEDGGQQQGEDGLLDVEIFGQVQHRPGEQEREGHHPGMALAASQATADHDQGEAGDDSERAAAQADVEREDVLQERRTRGQVTHQRQDQVQRTVEHDQDGDQPS